MNPNIAKHANNIMRFSREAKYNLCPDPDMGIFLLLSDTCISSLIKITDYKHNLNQIPVEVRSYELCFRAMLNNGYDLKIVPKEYRDAPMVLRAVKQDGVALQFIRLPEIPTPTGRAICWIAVTQDGNALLYVPISYLCAQIVLSAVTETSWAMEYVPIEYITDELAMVAVQLDGEMLQYVPHNMRTYEMCLLAVRNNFRAFKWVLKKYKTPEMIMAKNEFRNPRN